MLAAPRRGLRRIAPVAQPHQCAPAGPGQRGRAPTELSRSTIFSHRFNPPLDRDEQAIGTDMPKQTGGGCFGGQRNRKSGRRLSYGPSASGG